MCGKHVMRNVKRTNRKTFKPGQSTILCKTVRVIEIKNFDQIFNSL